MAASELIEALQALAHERKIDEFYLIDRLEASLAKSYQHILDLEYDARVTIDRNTGKIYVYELVPVGDPDPETGEYTDFEERDVTPDDVSRIAALNAKNVIGSIVRDAGRQSIYEEFSSRVGDLVTGTVLQGTPDFTIIKIRDGVEAELPHYDLKRYPDERNERPRNERYRHNQRLKTLIVEVRDPKLLRCVVSILVLQSLFLVLIPILSVVCSRLKFRKFTMGLLRLNLSLANQGSVQRSRLLLANLT